MNEESGLVEVPPHTDECEQLEQQEEQDVELRNQLTQSENQQHLEETVGVDPQGTEEVEKMQPVEETLDLPTQMCSERPEQPEQPEQPERTSESELKEQLSPEPEVTQQIQIQDVILKQADTTVGESHQAEESEVTDNEDVKKPEANGEQHKAPGSAFKNGKVDKAMARSLAERLFNLDRIQRADVVKHLDKE